MSARYETVAEIIADRDTLRAERDALRADAERYRWLRSNHRGRLVAVCIDAFEGDTILVEFELDAAIDAARKA